MSFAHEPVLLHEVLQLLDPRPGEIAVDATIGGGGHAAALAERVGPEGRLLGFDQDEDALAAARENVSHASCMVTFVHANFRHMQDELRTLGVPFVDMVLFDLGVSSPQLDNEGRGFSYWGGELDMRMNRHAAVTAEDLLRELPEAELARILYEYGEERFSRRIARKIVERRQASAIRTANELVDIVKSAIPAPARRHGGHPARRTFQALRIAVNDELEALRDGLRQSLSIVRPGGRIAVISFHSLEDRIVKHSFRNAEALEILTKKPVTAREEERTRNARARSAKLRAARVLAPRGGE